MQESRDNQDRGFGSPASTPSVHLLRPQGWGAPNLAQPSASGAAGEHGRGGLQPGKFIRILSVFRWGGRVPSACRRFGTQLAGKVPDVSTTSERLLTSAAKLGSPPESGTSSLSDKEGRDNLMPSDTSKGKPGLYDVSSMLSTRTPSTQVCFSGFSKLAT